MPPLIFNSAVRLSRTFEYELAALARMAKAGIAVLGVSDKRLRYNDTPNPKSLKNADGTPTNLP